MVSALAITGAGDNLRTLVINGSTLGFDIHRVSEEVPSPMNGGAEMSFSMWRVDAQ
jgi:hypothetical protein